MKQPAYLAVSVDAVNVQRHHFALVADGRLRASDKITGRREVGGGRGLGSGKMVPTNTVHGIDRDCLLHRLMMKCCMIHFNFKKKR